MTGLSSLLGTAGFGDLTSLLVNLVAVVEMLDFSCEVFQNNGKKKEIEKRTFGSRGHTTIFTRSQEGLGITLGRVLTERFVASILFSKSRCCQSVLWRMS